MRIPHSCSHSFCVSYAYIQRCGCASAPFLLSLLLVFGICGIVSAQSTWRLAQGTSGVEINSISFSTHNPDTVFALGHFVHISTDHGETWDTLSTGIVSSGECAIRVHPLNPRRIVASVGLPFPGNGIYVSSDGGINWVLKTGGTTDCYGRFVEFSDQSPAVAYSNRGTSNLMRSTDWGETWEVMSGVPFSSCLVSFAVALTNDSILYRVHSSRAFKSVDQGETWIQTRPDVGGSYSQVVVHPTNPAFLYLGLAIPDTEGNVVILSTNGGQTWEGRSKGLETSNIVAMAMNQKRPEEIFVGSTDEGILHTTNGGLAWEPFNFGLPQTAYISSIAIDTLSGRLLAAVYNGSQWGIYINDYSSDVDQTETALEFKLSQNSPNPFNSMTRIRWQVQSSGFVRLTVFNVLGQVVTVLEDGVFQHGEHESIWNAWQFPSGVYIYRIETASQMVARKMLLLK